MSVDTGAKLIPCLRYRDAPAAIDWLCKTFGFERHLVVPGEQGGAVLKFVDADRLFDPDAVYGKGGHGHSHD